MRSTNSMKRYFTSASEPGKSDFHCGSVYHYHSLPGGGWIIVMMDGGYDPDPSWTEMPHLLEGKAAGFAGTHHVLGEAALAGHAPLAGVQMSDTTYHVAKKLATVNRLFHP